MKHVARTRRVAAAALLVCVLGAHDSIAAAAAAEKTAATPASAKNGIAAHAPKPTTYTVTVDATQFQPQVLRIKPGDIVVWVNKDFFPHTATSKAGGFDSGAVGSGGKWSHTFQKSGEFPYICTLHPTTMKGTIRVK